MNPFFRSSTPEPEWLTRIGVALGLVVIALGLPMVLSWFVGFVLEVLF